MPAYRRSVSVSQSVDERETGRIAAFSSLAERPFRAWFGTQVLSASGTMTQSVAASWLVLQLTGSAVDLAVLAALTVGPTLLLGAWAGALADRVDRRRLLAATQSAFLLIGAALAVATWTGHATVPVVDAASLLTGIVMAVDGPARQVFVLDLVGRARLASAVSLYEVVLNASRILGPAAGGVLLGVWGPGACFAVNAATFVPPLVVLAVVRVRQARVERAAVRVSVLDGLRYAWSVPTIRACLLLAACTTTLFNAALVFPLLAQQSFHLGAGGYGLLVASFGLGALPGALVAASGSGAPAGRLVVTLAAVTGFAVILTSAAPDAVLAYAGMVVVGFVSIWFVAAANTLVQLRAAPAMRGRVMGAWTMALPGSGPVLGLAVAALIDVSSPRVGFAAVGVVLALAAALAARWVRSESATAPSRALAAPR